VVHHVFGLAGIARGSIYPSGSLKYSGCSHRILYSGSNAVTSDEPGDCQWRRAVVRHNHVEGKVTTLDDRLLHQYYQDGITYFRSATRLYDLIYWLLVIGIVVNVLLFGGMIILGILGMGGLATFLSQFVRPVMEH
jgi:hypothetical protein